MPSQCCTVLPLFTLELSLTRGVTTFVNSLKQLIYYYISLIESLHTALIFLVIHSPGVNLVDVYAPEGTVVLAIDNMLITTDKKFIVNELAGHHSLINFLQIYLSMHIHIVYVYTYIYSCYEKQYGYFPTYGYI